MLGQTRQEAVAAIAALPAGPRIAAFLDAELACASVTDEPPPPIRVGVLAADFAAETATWFRTFGAAGLSYNTWHVARAHARRGHTVVLVGSAPRERLAALAEQFDPDHILSTELEVTRGRLTGATSRSLRTADERAAAVSAFAAEHDIDLEAAIGYGVAGPGQQRALQLPDHTPGRIGAARTVASYGAFLGSTGVGIAVGLAARRRRAGVDAMTRTFGALGPALSGVHVEVHGAEHLRHRPAVFLINHQSHLVDAIVTFRLLGSGFTPVAKKQVKDIPALGQATQLAGWAYVDRVGDKTQARAAVADAVEKLGDGISVILAPEGTRSLGPKPGPFKKGGFYMAREAGVPIVPIVLRNCGELMWRNAKTIANGTVDVVVHPPIDCAAWDDDDLDARVAAVRQLYVDTLEDWPYL